MSLKGAGLQSQGPELGMTLLFLEIPASNRGPILRRNVYCGATARIRGGDTVRDTVRALNSGARIELAS